MEEIRKRNTSNYKLVVPSSDDLFNRQKNMKIGCLVEVLDEREPVLGIPEIVGIKYYKNNDVKKNCKINDGIRPSIHNDCRYVIDAEISSFDSKVTYKVKAEFKTTAIVDSSIHAKLPLMLDPGQYFSLNSDSNYIKAELKSIKLSRSPVKYEMDSIYIVNDGMGVRWSCKLYEE